MAGFSDPQLRDLLEIRGLTAHRDVMLFGEQRGKSKPKDS